MDHFLACSKPGTDHPGSGGLEQAHDSMQTITTVEFGRRWKPVRPQRGCGREIVRNPSTKSPEQQCSEQRKRGERSKPDNRHDWNDRPQPAPRRQTHRNQFSGLLRNSLTKKRMPICWWLRLSLQPTPASLPNPPTRRVFACLNPHRFYRFQRDPTGSTVKSFCEFDGCQHPFEANDTPIRSLPCGMRS